MDKQNKNSRARIAANNRYNARAYDRVNIAIKKGTRDIIRDVAQSQGLTPSAYIKKAIQRQYKADTDEDITL